MSFESEYGTRESNSPSWVREGRSETINIRIEPSLRDAMLERGMDTGLTLAAYVRSLAISDLEKQAGTFRAGQWETERRSVNLNVKIEPTLRVLMKERAKNLGLGLTDYVRFLAIVDLSPKSSTKSAKGKSRAK